MRASEAQRTAPVVNDVRRDLDQPLAERDPDQGQGWIDGDDRSDSDPPRVGTEAPAGPSACSPPPRRGNGRGDALPTVSRWGGARRCCAATAYLMSKFVV